MSDFPPSGSNFPTLRAFCLFLSHSTECQCQRRFVLSSFTHSVSHPREPIPIRPVSGPASTKLFLLIPRLDLESFQRHRRSLVAPFSFPGTAQPLDSTPSSTSSRGRRGRPPRQSYHWHLVQFPLNPRLPHPPGLLKDGLDPGLRQIGLNSPMTWPALPPPTAD